MGADRWLQSPHDVGHRLFNLGQSGNRERGRHRNRHVFGDEYTGSSQPARHLCKTAPSTPYSAIFLFGWVDQPYSAFDWGGAEWRNTTSGNTELQAIWLEGYGPNGNAPLVVSWETNGTGWSANVGPAAGVFPPTNTIWMKLKNDGTKMYEYYSLDGATWILAYSQNLSGSYLGATGYNQLCFMTVEDENTAEGITLMSYYETSP